MGESYKKGGKVLHAQQIDISIIFNGIGQQTKVDINHSSLAPSIFSMMFCENVRQKFIVLLASKSINRKQKTGWLGFLGI